MKKIFLILIIFPLLFFSCSKDDYTNGFDSSIIEKPNTNKLKQLLLLINLKINDKYVILEQIDSVKFKVNNKIWGIYSSEKVDTSNLGNNMINDFKVTDKEISYQLIAPYQIRTEKPETVGDYITYMNEKLQLTPGDYLCEIDELIIKDEKNKSIVIKPYLFKEFTVTENTTSSFVGKIELTIKE